MLTLDEPVFYFEIYLLITEGCTKLEAIGTRLLRIAGFPQLKKSLSKHVPTTDVYFLILH